MVPIYICEDNNEQLNWIVKIIENYILIEDLDMAIVSAATNPEEILKYIKDEMPMGVYFFDIDLCAKLDGFRLAECVRSKDSLGSIIFITSHTELWRLSFEYKVAALEFIEKNRVEELPNHICEALSCAWERYISINKTCKKAVPFKINGRVIYKDVDDILFLETSAVPHRIEIHTLTSCISISGSLNKLEKILPDYFFRSHKSYFVNLHKVISFDEDSNTLEFANTEKCLVSFRKVRAVKDAMQLYSSTSASGKV